MVDRPIIFSAAMVRALLDGRKTQTRRLATSPLRKCEAGDRLWVRESCCAEELSRPDIRRAATRKERQYLGRTEVVVCDELDGADGVRYLADDAWVKIESSMSAAEAWSEMFYYRGRGKNRIGNPVPSIHMPRWAARLTLIVEAVRVEPLQAISEEDCIAEGPKLRGWMEGLGRPLDGWMVETDQPHVSVTPRWWYRELWDALHGAGSWDANPDVVVLTFRVIRGNIDRIEP